MNIVPSGWRQTSWALLTLIFCSNSFANAELQDQVKAGFVLNFAKFVEWPAERHSSQQSPVNICVLGNDERAELIFGLFKERRIGQRPVKATFNDSVDPSLCHLAYITGQDNTEAERWLSRFVGTSTLTVYETKQNLDNGIIRFLLADNKVRFAINNRVANQGALKISSKLLGVAVQTQP